MKFKYQNELTAGVSNLSDLFKISKHYKILFLKMK